MIEPVLYINIPKLTEKNINDNLINEDKMFVYNEKYVSKKDRCYYSCPWIEHGLVFFHNKIANCCICGHTAGGHTLLRDNYSGQSIDWDRIFKIKEIYRKFHKKGKINKNCIGCPFLKEAKWDNIGNFIDNMYISHWSNCNSKCIYCFSSQHPEKFENKKRYSVLPILKDMFQRGYLSADADISFGGGEPTLLDEFEDIMNFLLDNYFWGIRVHTSGIKYSQAMARAINEIRGYVVVSVDAGSKEVYEKVKQVPMYDMVRENIRKYALQTTFLGRFLISAKYIIIPGINDTKEEIEKWILANKEAGLYTTVLDIEENWYHEHSNNIPKYIFDLVEYAKKRSKKLHTNFELYERLQNVYYNNRGNFFKRLFKRK